LQNHFITRNTRGGCLRLLFFMLFACPFAVRAQSFDLIGKKKHVNLPFTTVRNMVVVKLTINNKGPFNFILDTGVGVMLITDPTLVDSINLESKRTIKIYGLNGDSYEAYVTPNLKIEMRNITSTGVSAAILKEDHFSLSSYTGMPIHGLLGYDFFSNLAVRFNFYDSTITVSKPLYARQIRKGVKIPLSIEDRKPYIFTDVKMPDGKILSRKLLVDLGAGHPLSLENMLAEQGLPENFIPGNLGMGLTGPIKGYISRVSEIRLGSYKLNNVITSFPDTGYIKNAALSVPRDGNLGIGVLKRFTVLIDYSNNALYIKKGPNFNEPFEHDMTGMEYFFDGVDFSHLIVGRVEIGSPADIMGLKKDDEILAINLKTIDQMSIEQIDNLFRSKDGRNLLLDVRRDKRLFRTVIALKKRI